LRIVLFGGTTLPTWDMVYTYWAMVALKHENAILLQAQHW
jgi:hypothetical protein